MSPFLYSGIKVEVVQSSGHLPVSQTDSMISRNSLATVSPPSFNSSAVRLSGPAALSGFNDFRAFSISSIELTGSVRSHLNPSIGHTWCADLCSFRLWFGIQIRTVCPPSLKYRSVFSQHLTCFTPGQLSFRAGSLGEPIHAFVYLCRIVDPFQLLQFFTYCL